MKVISLRRTAGRIAIAALPLLVAGCGLSALTEDRAAVEQPYPASYRVELLAFFKTYLNNPVGVRNAALADPVQRTVRGNPRYVVCVRYDAADSDGRFRGPRERGVLFVDNRLDRIADDAGDLCAGANYQPFPEMEKMTR